MAITFMFCSSDKLAIATVSLFILCSIYSADKLAYFQIRILGISDCEEWQVSVISASAAAMIHYQIVFCTEYSE